MFSAGAFLAKHAFQPKNGPVPSHPVRRANQNRLKFDRFAEIDLDTGAKNANLSAP